MLTPPAPLTFDIPAATVKRWNDFPANAPLVLTLTRTDIDHLFFAIDENIRATQSLQKAIIDYSNGELPNANQANADAQQRLGVSANRLRLFMNAVMVSAELET